MWNKINSPIVITVIAIAALFALRATMKPKLANEIRETYKELVAITEDGASDAQKSKAIKEFAQEIASQIRDGFSAGFKSNKLQTDDKDKIYAETKQKISISGIKFVKSEWPGREKVIFMVRNGSDKPIGDMKFNYEYYKQGVLIDCANGWTCDVKIFDPNQEIALSQDRTLPKEETDNYRSDEVKIKLISFNVKKTN